MNKSHRPRHRDEDGTVRPWDVPGNVRRDCEPHRGSFLVFLARVAAGAGLASFFGGLTAFVAVPLGVAVWILARQDLRKMGEGRMDPAGRRDTIRARLLGATAVVVSVALSPLFYLVYILATR